MAGRVRELVIGLAQAERLDHGAVRNTAEREYYGTRGQRAEFICEEGVARIDLRADGFVVGRQALHRVRDPAVH